MNNKIIGIVIAIIFMLSLTLLLMSNKQSINTVDSQSRYKVIIATPQTPPPGLVFIAYEKGFFSNEGLDVSLQKHSSGKTSLKAVLEQQANIGVTSENPIMHAVLNKQKIKLISSILSTGKNYVILARKDRAISSIGDLKGKTIGVTSGTNSEFLLDAMLTLHTLDPADIKKVNIKPGEIVNAIVNQKVDAISSWNPHILKARKQLKDNHVLFYGAELYTATFNLAAMTDYIEENPIIIEKLLRALLNAQDFVIQQPQQALNIIAGHVKITKEMLSELWAIYNYKLTLDQSLINTMESQAKWAISKNMTKETNVPNYFNNIYLEGMNKIAPHSVTVIH